MSQQSLFDLVAAIPDPEIPVVTIADLGILRGVNEEQGKHVCVAITPTYSGCPAMNTISEDIVATLSRHGIQARVELVLDPPWTTDSITAEGREKLKAWGIAPPVLPRPVSAATTPISDGLMVPLFTQPLVCCPRCDSAHTTLVSAFGATACKEQWQCQDCLEPFEYFKCHR